MIYLDSCLVIYLVEAHDKWGDAVAKAIRRNAKAEFALSPLVKCECLIGPLKRGDPVLEHAYLDFFDRLRTLTMPEPIYLEAAQLRARFGLKTPDALHLSCAQHYHCEALWTNDSRLTQASHGLARNILSN